MGADGGLEEWAGHLGRRPAGGRSRGWLRFAFYGRVSTEDWQDPARRWPGSGSRPGRWCAGTGRSWPSSSISEKPVRWHGARRPQAAALVAQLADPGRGWDAVVIGGYERAFYGAQYALMVPLFEHYGIRLWLPEAGGRVDFSSEHDWVAAAPEDAAAAALGAASVAAGTS